MPMMQEVARTVYLHRRGTERRLRQVPQSTTAFKRRSRENEFPGGCANADIACERCSRPPACCWRSRRRSLRRTIPTKPVRLIIPFPPGGSNDVVGPHDRDPSERAARQAGGRGQPRRRRRRRGRVPRSPRTRPTTATPCSIISLAHAVNPWLYKLPYDPIKSFTPVAILASGPNVLVVNPDLPVQFGEGPARRRQGRSRASCNMPRPASAASSISAASCSSSPPASTSCTCRSRAAARP